MDLSETNVTITVGLEKLKKKNKQEKTDAHIMLTLNVDALELNANSRLASL